MADIAQSSIPLLHVTTPGHIVPLVQKDDMEPANREYNFFVSTNSQHQPDGVDRGLIRRLVMRNFFDTRCASARVETCASANNSANTVLAKKQLKNRFRLSDVGAEPKRSRKGNGNRSKETTATHKKDENEKESAVTAKKKRPKATRTTSTSTNASNNTSISPTTVFPAWQSSSSIYAQCRPQASVSWNPSTQLLDPFSVLPVPNSPHLTFLFKLYKSTTPLNSLATNPSSTWWSFISCSAALLHATLATWALYGLMVCKGKGVEGLKLVEWGLKHKWEAIKGMERGIREGRMGMGGYGLEGRGGAGVSEEVIGCVVVVASFENLQGTYDAAHLHIVALRRMVHARGGLESLQHNEGLVRGIIWVEFHTSTAHHTPPSFPFLHPTPSPPLPDAFLELAALTSPTSLLHLSLSAIPCFNIFYRLHRLGLALSPAWFGKLDRTTLSDMLYETEYMILTVPDNSRVYINFDLNFETEGSGEEFETRQKDANAAAVVEGIMAAAQIFVYAALRGLPRNARIFAILEERVKRALDRVAARSLVEIWIERGNAKVLLWVLTMACSVTGDRGWYVARVVEVLAMVGLETKIEMETVLRHVAWVDGYLDRVVTEVWTEVLISRQQGLVGIDALSNTADERSVFGIAWDTVDRDSGINAAYE